MSGKRADVRLPDLGDVESARVVAWLRQVGEGVVEGDDLLEVETEKTTFVVPAPVTGRLDKIIARESTRVHEGDVLGSIAL